MTDMTALQNLFKGFTINTKWLALALLIGIVVDLMTILIENYKFDGKLSFSKIKSDIFKKCGIILVVAISYGLSVLFTDKSFVIANAVQCYYIYAELVSIFKNLNNLGVSLPKIFTKMLDKDDNKNNNPK